MGQIPRAQRSTVEQVSPSASLPAPTAADEPLFTAARTIDDRAQIVNKEKMVADDILSKQLAINLTDLRNNTIAEYSEKKGLDASANFDSYQEQFEDSVANLTRDLSPEQRYLSQPIIDNARSVFNHSMNQHLSTETSIVKADTNKDLIVNRINDSAINFTNPDIVANNSTQIVATIEDLATHQGWSKETTDKVKTDTFGKFGLSIINAALNGKNIGLAREYLTSYEERMDPDSRAKANKNIRTTFVNSSSKENAYRIFNKTDNYSDQNAEVAKIKDDEIRTKTATELNTIRVAAKKAQTQSKEDARKKATDLVWNGHAVSDLPLEISSQLSSSDFNSLYKLEKNSRSGTGPTERESYTEYYKLIIASTEDPEKYKKTNLMDYAHKLTPGHFKQLVDIQVKLKNGFPLGPIEKYNQAAIRFLDSKNLKGKKERAEFLIKLGFQLEAYREIEGDYPKYNELDNILNGMVKDFDKWWTWGDDFFFTKELEDIPKEDVSSAREYLLGKEILPQNITPQLLRSAIAQMYGRGY